MSHDLGRRAAGSASRGWEPPGAMKQQRCFRFANFVASGRVLRSFTAWLALLVTPWLVPPATAAAVGTNPSGFLSVTTWEPTGGGRYAGYIEFDPASFAAYDDWLSRQDACWDETEAPCADLPSHFTFALDILAAAVVVRGRLFDTREITWTNTDRCYPYCDALIEISMRDWSGDSVGIRCYQDRADWLRNHCSDYFLSYSIRGVQGGSHQPPYLALGWQESPQRPPWPAPEPGSAALFGLGLALLEAMRRRATLGSEWWAVMGSNHRPLPCESSALPLS